MIKKKIPITTIILYLIFTISLSLRLVLAIVNDGSANDDHLEVSRLIFDNNKIPKPQDCRQCYHPKLYHFAVAKLWDDFKINKVKEKIILAQLINAIAGILTIFICWLFIKEQTYSEHAKLLCFSMVAFNPRFIAINAQATNDSLLIFFGTIILYSLYQLMSKPTIKYFILLLVSINLAGITKGNSLILIIGVIIVFIIKIITNKNYNFSINKGYLGSLSIILIITILFVGYFGEYYGNYKTYGKPFVFNTQLGEIPHLFKETSFRRPGVKSIIGGYLSFRIIDIIKNPVITNDKYKYPLHRTSVWSQLYGRTHFIYFDYWPPGLWQCNDPKMMAVGRIALALALFPSILFLLCLLKDIRMWSALFFRKTIDCFKNSNEWIFHIFIFGFVVFIILFTAFGRDFSFMKMIYLFPCVLAVLIPLLKGFENVYKFVLKNRVLFIIFYASIFTLLVCYLIPVLNLITKLVS